MTEIKQDIKMYQRIALLMIADIAFVFLASFISILVRLDFANIDWDLLNSYLRFYWLDVIIVITIFWLFNMYKSMWRFASLVELRRLIIAVVTTAIIKLFVFELFFPPIIIIISTHFDISCVSFCLNSVAKHIVFFIIKL